jgi:nucleoside-diphosphate-sugar epimerase
MPQTIVVQGAAGPVGRRVCERLLDDPTVRRVVAIVSEGELAPPGTEPAAPPTTPADAKDLLEGASALILLGSSGTGGADLDGTGRVTVDLEEARLLLEGAASASVPHVVVLSSALVYGAWPTNPVPLTEEAPARPNPDLPFAVALARLERLAVDWAAAHPGTTVARLRPVVAVAADRSGWLARSPWDGTGIRARGAEAPVQFVHLDDLAAAVDLARRVRWDGPANVAPEGWLTPDALRALRGPAPRLRLPTPLVRRWWARRRPGGARPSGVLAATAHPWVVASDRLRAAGWRPAYSCEEAFVAADRSGPWRSLSPRARQELSLAVAGILALAVLGGVIVGLRRRIRSRR